jgi:hypothetical protein
LGAVDMPIGCALTFSFFEASDPSDAANLQI